MEKGTAGAMLGFVEKLEEVLSDIELKGARNSAQRARELQPLLHKALLLGLEEAATIVERKAADYHAKGKIAESDACAGAGAQIRARIAMLEDE
ncbi:MAG: hypothetical protein AB7S92_03265 [Parvibaculaceae bacterium]